MKYFELNNHQLKHLKVISNSGLKQLHTLFTFLHGAIAYVTLLFALFTWQDFMLFCLASGLYVVDLSAIHLSEVSQHNDILFIVNGAIVPCGYSENMMHV